MLKPPRRPTRPAPLSRSPRLTSSGWTQVYPKQRSAPHESRFARVPGGWRSRVVLCDTSDAPTEATGQATTEAAPWVHEASEETKLENKPSQISLAPSRTMVSSVSRASLNSLLRPGGTFAIEKRSPRREPKVACAWRTWPAHYIEEEKRRNEEKRLLEEQQKEDAFGEEEDPNDEEELRLNHRCAVTGLTILEPGGRRLSTELVGGRRFSEEGRRLSIGGRRRSSATSEAGFSRRGSRQSIEADRRSSIGSNYDFSDLKPSRQRGFPDAVEVAEEEEEAARAEGCSHLERRARRLHAFSEALLSSPEVIAREEEAAQMQLGAGLEDAAQEDEEDFVKLQHDQVRELAALFVEFDGDLTGFIEPHDLRSLLRRAGRALSAEEIHELLDSLPNWDASDMDNQLDFLDLLELLDLREHTERIYLRGVFRDKFKGAAGGGIRPELRELAKALEEVHITLNSEQVRRSAMEMGLPQFPGYLMIHREAQLFLLAERCRKFEKLRVHERAGFSLEQVQRFQFLYEQIVRRPSQGATLKEMTAIMIRFPIPIEDNEMKGDLEEIFYCGRDDGTELGLWDCLHAARRFQDTKDIDQLSLERDAAIQVGIPQAELVGFRNFYDKLIEEDSTKDGGFTFFILSKAVRIMGATLTMEKNKELEQLFKQHASPSHSDSVLKLSFSQFILVVGRLFKEDFAGIRSWTEGLDGSKDQDFRLAGLRSQSRRFTRRSGLV
mmetsp:Transcript_5893/g.10518  ORF Transcript_5893/g.10518 Transcript_5893/m.10518 type:complete len:724 (+) Transcript_5893:106-2277(+)